MRGELRDRLIKKFGATGLVEQELIQSLWSGYGQISRYALQGSEVESLIVKHIKYPANFRHPRGWNSNASHLRKVKSYEVEQAFYKHWSAKCTDSCRVPEAYESSQLEDGLLLVLEDLDTAGFPQRRSRLSVEEAKLGLRWLANFHALFMGQSPEALWLEGSYWHLATRADEFEAMEEGKLKKVAKLLNQKLANARFQTIIHGDAKVANFCFSEDMQQLAAVDFQYVGGGCGMKDVVYFLGSCLSEAQCEKEEEELLQHYFQSLSLALRESKSEIDAAEVEKEWRDLYAIAWTDFTRFLMGWMPGHQKINGYSLKLMHRAFEPLSI